MQIHSEYTLRSRIMWLRGMLAGVEEVRFSLDQDAGMRAESPSAFAADIRYARTVDLFSVSISKNLTVDQNRREKLGAAKRLLENSCQDFEGPVLVRLCVTLSVSSESLNFGSSSAISKILSR